MVSDFQHAGETFIPDQNISFIQNSCLADLHPLEQNALGIDLKPGLVPATTFYFLADQSSVTAIG